MAKEQKSRGRARPTTKAPAVLKEGATAVAAALSPQELLLQVAHDEGIPASGITVLGGKPYINVTGLDVKLRNLCAEQGLVHAGTEYVPIQTVKDDSRAGGWGIVRLFDKPGFEKALAMAAKAGPISKEVIEALKEMYYRVFKMRGFASVETLKMGAMQKADNIEMMAERRATNRAKREATGTGLTSSDEMDSVLLDGMTDGDVGGGAPRSGGGRARPAYGGSRSGGPGKPTEKQVSFIKSLMSQTGVGPDVLTSAICKKFGLAEGAVTGSKDLTYDQAKWSIDALLQIKNDEIEPSIALEIVVPGGDDGHDDSDEEEEFYDDDE